MLYLRHLSRQPIPTPQNIGCPSIMTQLKMKNQPTRIDRISVKKNLTIATVYFSHLNPVICYSVNNLSWSYSHSSRNIQTINKNGGLTSESIELPKGGNGRIYGVTAVTSCPAGKRVYEWCIGSRKKDLSQMVWCEGPMSTNWPNIFCENVNSKCCTSLLFNCKFKLRMLFTHPAGKNAGKNMHLARHLHRRHA